MRYSRPTLFLLALILASSPARADEEFEPFVGDFEGKYTTVDGGIEKSRDLSVSIHETSDGFNVSWKTTTFKKKKKKTKGYSIDFIKSDREHIFQAAQKKNVFGGREPLDPMKGDPYVWARIEGAKLTVYALNVTEDGGYEMQTFNRVLMDDKNLHLKFSRFRDGKPLKSIDTILYRQ
ncbi:hypothetical protein N9H39_04635 [Gammaproteobacteria bacterium]|nr:hypothetical protein [Gammaproteobacteria bacterium]